MAINYPSPCEKCVKNPCKKTIGCDDWQIWFRWWWKRFHAVYKNKKRSHNLNAWRYMHPDEVALIVNHSPCDKCMKTECDIPCDSYFSWYNLRMEIARKKAGL